GQGALAVEILDVCRDDLLRVDPRKPFVMLAATAEMIVEQVIVLAFEKTRNLYNGLAHPRIGPHDHLHHLSLILTIGEIGLCSNWGPSVTNLDTINTITRIDPYLRHLKHAGTPSENPLADLTCRIVPRPRGHLGRQAHRRA